MFKKIMGRKLKSLFTTSNAIVVINLAYVLAMVFMLTCLRWDDVFKAIVFLMAYMVLKGLEDLIHEINRETHKVIRVNKRFTHKNDETGAIEIRKEDFQQAILLLYELENKLDNER